MIILRIFPRVAEMAGGMEAHIRWLTDEQRKSGLRCFLMMNEGTPLHDDDIMVASHRHYYDTHPGFVGIFRFYFQVIKSLWRRPVQADILHLHGDWSTFIFAPVLKKLTGCSRVCFSFHGMLHGGITHRWLLPWTARFCDIFFVTGYQNYQQLAYNGKMVFQPSGIRPLFLMPSSQTVVVSGGRKRIVTTCVLRPAKNVGTVIAIARLLPEYDFIIIGDGPERSALEAIVRETGTANVSFEGYLPPERVKNQLERADLFLFTSLEEGTPTAVLEAMACGLPIVSSNAGGTESVVSEGINGFVVKNNYKDAPLYIEPIQKILTNKDLCSAISENNRLKIQLFSWEKVAQNITKKSIG